MKLFKTILICTVVLGFGSCNTKKKEKEPISQMEVVMQIHDEVMPKITTVGKLTNSLKKKAANAENPEQYKKAQNDLEQANEAMMTWMIDFNERFSFDEINNKKDLSEEKQQWLDEEEIKIKEVRNKINESIERAQTLLK